MSFSNIGEYAHALSRVEEACKNAWVNPQHSHYTKHSLGHSETIIKKLAILLKGQKTDFTPVETFIILSACYLHDIGMQCTDKKLLQNVCEIDASIPYPFPTDALDKIRTKHAKLSYRMIKEKLNSTFEGVNYLIVDAIARVSRAHSESKEVYEASCPEKDTGVPGIPTGAPRLRLLAVLLRLGDGLDADTNRSDMDRLIKIADRLPVLSQAHFWKHYFVSTVDVDNGLIQFNYTIPNKHESAKSGIQKMAEEHIREHTKDLEEIWRKYGVKIGITTDSIFHNVPESPYEMPQIAIDFFIDYPFSDNNPLPEIPSSYKSWLKDRCGTMDTTKLAERESVITVSLPDLYIPLYTNPPDSVTKGKKPVKQSANEERQPVDIEKLAEEKEYLLVSGHAGCGKTTLLKHLAYTVIENEKPGLNGYLPILIFLKEHPLVTGEHKATHIAYDNFFTYMQNYGLGIDTISRYKQKGKVLFLVDGLDEVVDIETREKVITFLADFRTQCRQGCKIILSGRPHAMNGLVTDRFGDMHINVNTLTFEQVEWFINRWFRFVYAKEDAISSTAVETAKKMISEIRYHPAVDKLVETPLMLTAMCILYNDDRVLPEHRAELYKRFVDNLIFRRFRGDAEKTLSFLSLLAHQMHKDEIKGISEKEALHILYSVYSKVKGEGDDEYRLRCRQTFELIEQNCGLLKFVGGEYLFWHLTFQEFLAAVYIVDNEYEYIAAIEDYWGNDWYKEVIQLYIGYLSIRNKRPANKIVECKLNEDESVPFKCWLLAAKSLVDIHKDRRDEQTVNLARKRMLSVIEAGALEEVAPLTLAEAGEILGRLGDTRNLEEFVKIESGRYFYQDGHVDIDEFEIAKYLVTNQWFKKFVDAGGYKEDGRLFWSDDGLKWLEEEKIEYPIFWHDRKWNCPNAPVVGVSWYEAEAFCNWLTEVRKDGYLYRLPDEKEWEAAARGREGREYPWGEEGVENRCNYDESKIGATSSVGIFLKGNTPATDISDLAGNVWEWCADLWDVPEDVPGGDGRVLRGGSWLDSAGYVRSAYQDWDRLGNSYDDFGFRLSRGQEKQE